MTQTTSTSRYAEKLEAELNRMVNEQFDSPEFRLMFDTPLTMERARYFALQFVFYNVNRRDCWAYVQAKAPWEVKRAIWEHESDELHFDKRGGSDHRGLMTKEAMALGVTAEQVAKAEPSSLITATMWGFNHINITHPWLGAITASHFLERRNNNKLIKSGRGSTKRWRDRLVQELGIDPAGLSSSNVHVVADEEHTDLIWETVRRHVTDEESYKLALNGARESAQLDRAVRGAMATGMRLIEG